MKKNTAKLAKTIQVPVKKPGRKEMSIVDAKDPAGVGNVDKIRDILFGSNMRDYDQRQREVLGVQRRRPARERDDGRQQYPGRRVRSDERSDRHQWG